MTELLEGISTIQLMIMLIPIFIVQLGLIVFAILQLNKYGVRNLTKITWLIIIVLINTIGPILYLLIGRNSDDYSD
ncbi:MAG: PLDc N-terminal domain-containing protein [Clostridiales bacterium]|nr:PLDc N-terminal domain-containing protein [Clostridiales bacterium]